MSEYEEWVKRLVAHIADLERRLAEAQKEIDYYKHRMEIAHAHHPSCGCDCRGCLGLIENTPMWKTAKEALKEAGE